MERVSNQADNTYHHARKLAIKPASPEAVALKRLRASARASVDRRRFLGGFARRSSGVTGRENLSSGQVEKPREISGTVARKMDREHALIQRERGKGERKKEQSGEGERGEKVVG